MKTSAIKGYRKRKQKNISLLKIANSKKTRIQQNMEMTSVHVRKGIKKAKRIQNKSLLYPDKQFMVAKPCSAKFVHGQHNMSYLIENDKNFDTNAFQNSISKCACSFCRRKNLETFKVNHQRQIQRANQNRLLQTDSYWLIKKFPKICIGIS